MLLSVFAYWVSSRLDESDELGSQRRQQISAAVS